MDGEALYGPNQRCRYSGRPFWQGPWVTNGRSHGQKPARCRACAPPVAIRYGTASVALHADAAIVAMAVRACAAGNAMRATARIVQVDKDAVGVWRQRAAQHCRLVLLDLGRDLHVMECQRDALGSFVHTKHPHRPVARLFEETSGDAWVGGAFAPGGRLGVACVLGQRTPQSAALRRERVLHVPAAPMPFFTREQ
jgi:hypothetical protein